MEGELLVPREGIATPPERRLILPPNVERKEDDELDRNLDQEDRDSLDVLEREIAEAGAAEPYDPSTSCRYGHPNCNCSEAPIQKIGVCRGSVESRRGVVYKCGRHTLVWLPAQLCTKCLLKAAAELEAKEEDDEDG